MFVKSVDIGLFVVFIVSAICVCIASRFELFRDSVVHTKVTTSGYLSSWCLSVVS